MSLFKPNILSAAIVTNIATDANIKPRPAILIKFGTTPGQCWYFQTSFLAQHRNSRIQQIFDMHSKPMGNLMKIIGKNKKKAT